MTESLSLDAAETWVTTVNGRLYAKRWGGTADDAALPPIVLLHDSLGCVALWREFPQRLVQATGRAVIAYDRPDRRGFHPAGSAYRFFRPD